MFEYFLLQFLTIGFEKEYKSIEFISISDEDIKNYKVMDINLKYFLKSNKSLTKIILKNITLGKVIVPTISFILYYSPILFQRCKKKRFKKKNKIINKIENKSILLLEGIHGILCINSIISAIFSFLSLLGYKEKLLSYFLIPILLTKFYFFTFNYYCVSISQEQKGYELLMSGSTLISFYLIIWNTILKYTILKFIKNENTFYMCFLF